MTEPASREIRLAGLGGQGVILAGVVLGQAAVFDGLYAAGSNSYGAQARGSACQAEVVIAPRPIDYPHVEAADLLVAMSQGGYDAYREETAPQGLIFYDSGLVKPADMPQPQRGFDVTAAALGELGNRQAANLVWVGVVAGATGWFSEQALRRAVEQHVPARFLELNLKALARGMELGGAVKEKSGAGPHA